ncbi:hypothetical protein ACRALDRAFT_2047245 [Sodiomyces alcalophilus JCM 7366]|uniref:uncharacterized protein n=1 Tax=Sodiomyces alcalophilus JCM 7366 TaxID=591952 RepID=UPI0039B3CE61
MIGGLDWTLEDTYADHMSIRDAAIAYGYSSWCKLFTYEEWNGFSHSIDLAFAENTMRMLDEVLAHPAFHCHSGARTVGIGYPQEVVDRIKHHTLGYSHSQTNATLDGNEETFPLNQTFGFKQFTGLLKPDTYPGPHDFTVSHVTLFGARLDLEIIRTPKTLAADRPGYLEVGGETNFPECGIERVEGWRELETFLKVQEAMSAQADYDRSCFGALKTLPYGYARAETRRYAIQQWICDWGVWPSS